MEGPALSSDANPKLRGKNPEAERLRHESGTFRSPRGAPAAHRENSSIFC